MTNLDYIIDPGALDTLISIEEKTTDQDAYGQETDAFEEVATVWAHIKYGGGSESETDRQTVGRQTVIFTIRQRELTKKNRISYNGGKYDIESIAVKGRNRFLEIETNLVDSNPA